MAHFERRNGERISRIEMYVNSRIVLIQKLGGPDRRPLRLESSNPLIITVADVNRPATGPITVRNHPFSITSRGTAGPARVRARVQSGSQRGKEWAEPLFVTVVHTIELPDRNTGEGALARLLIAESRTRFQPGEVENVRTGMQWMHRVVVNRLNHNPAQFNAPNARTVIDIIKARGQFDGFSNYPTLSVDVEKRIRDRLGIANNDNHLERDKFARFIRDAINVARAPAINDPCPTLLFGWRTENSSSPGGRFSAFRVMAGNQFYTLTR